MNTVVSITQYFPSYFEHDGFSINGTVQKQSGELIFDKDYSLPRGYSESDGAGGLVNPNNLLLSLEYHFPLAYPDTGWGLSVVHFHMVKSSLFSDWGSGWEDGAFSLNEWKDGLRQSVGGSLRTNATLFSMMPVELGIEAGYKIKERERFANLIFLLGF
jgi:hypothetical protein